MGMVSHVVNGEEQASRASLKCAGAEAGGSDVAREKPDAPSAPLGAALPRKIAIVHDWLPELGGAEKVLREMVQIFPQADVFTLLDFLKPCEREFLKGRKVSTSFLQRAPFIRTQYRRYLPLMPLAIEHFDLSEYPLIVSSSYAVAKGVISGPDQLHLCYCHSPMRYAWDLQEQYLRQTRSHRGMRGFCARALLQYIRLWDLRTPNGVDGFAANSHFISRRIWKVYRRRARVIYPPAISEVSAYGDRGGNAGGFYLSLGRLVPYKRVDLLLDAFREMPHRKLKVIGNGPEFWGLKRVCPANVEMMGYQPQRVVEECLKQAKALVFAAEEDFGIAPVEAQAQGTPVIALGKGGALETVLDGRTGVLFSEQTPGSIVEAVERFEKMDFDSEALRQNAARFSGVAFQRAFLGWVREEWNRFERHRKTSGLGFRKA